MQKIRFGLVGCGFISLNHGWAISTLENAELVAVADINPEASRQVAERFGASWYTKYGDLLEREDIDAIAIATPSGLHAEQTIAAAEARKHVIVEKPMSISLKEANQMIRICKENGVKLGCIFQQRFLRPSQQIKRAAEEGRFGRLFCGGTYVKWYRLQKYYHASGGWRGTWRYDGGGALINQSIHTIDLLQWIMGPVKKVFGRTATVSHKIETEDVGVASLEFENGAFGTIEGATSAYPGLFARLEINGTNGCAVIENGALKTWKFVEKKEKEPQEEKVPSGDAVGAGPSVGVDFKGRDPSKSGIAHREQYQDFVNAILEDREPLVNGEEAKKAIEIVLAIYRSAQEGKEVNLPLQEKCSGREKEEADTNGTV